MKGSQLLQQNSTETLSWGWFILNTALSHYDAELFIWGFYIHISFYEISYTQQITLQVLRVKLFGFFFNKLEFKYRET